MDRPLQNDFLLPSELPTSPANVNHSPEDGDAREKRCADESQARVVAGATIRHLYPELALVGSEAAAANLLRYCEIALLVATKLPRDATHLTGPDTVPTMKERSNVHSKE